MLKEKYTLSEEYNEWYLKIDRREQLSIKKYKSILIIGNIQIKNTKHFNWFQKKMFKLIFGIKIIDIEGIVRNVKNR